MKAITRFAASILMVLLPLVTAALFVAAFLGAPPALGQVREPVLQIQAPGYSAQLAAERRELLRILGRTRVCMFDATTAIRREVGRARIPAGAQEAAIKGFVKNTCSGQIRPFLVGVSRWSEADADAFVDELVDREVAASTSWGTP